jgi:hypothetical protein
MKIDLAHIRGKLKSLKNLDCKQTIFEAMLPFITNITNLPTKALSSNVQVDK